MVGIKFTSNRLRGNRWRKPARYRPGVLALEDP